MFQLEKIRAAHAKVKSGADFPRYIQDLRQLGVTRYETFVEDGRVVYFGPDNFQIESPPRYVGLEVANESKNVDFAAHLKQHQEGMSDYPAFCQQAAMSGIEKWIVDLLEMHCTYFDKAGYQILQEEIPVAKYFH